MVFIFLTLTHRNIFINLFRASKRKRRIKSLAFRSLNSAGLNDKSKQNHEEVEDMAWSLEQYLYFSPFDYAIFIFHKFGAIFKKRHQKRRNLLVKSKIFIRYFERIEQPFLYIIDNSPLTFNGCKTTKIRRKKRRRYIKKA